MANVKDELHSEDAKLEQGEPGGLEPETLSGHLTRQSGVGTGESRKIPQGTLMGLPAHSHKAHLLKATAPTPVGIPLPAFMTQVSNRVNYLFQGAKG